MRKIFTLFVVAFAALSTYAGELKIGENDSKSYKAPIYVTWADKYYCSQLLYSATELSALRGQQITKLAFFLRAVNSNGDYSNVEIRFKEVDFTVFEEASFVSIDDAVLVYEGSLPSGSSTTLEVALVAPYVYQGGTLLVDVRKTVTGGAYAPTSGDKGRFQSTSGLDNTVLWNYGSSEFPTTAYLETNRPDIRFTYEEAAAVACPNISSLSASDVAAHEATLTWESDAENFQFVCAPKGEEPVWDGVAPQALKSVKLDNLNASAEYDFYVRSFCSETEQGAAKKVSFQTELSCYAPTLLAVPETQITFESAVLTWHASGKGETQYQYTFGAVDSEPNWEGAPTTAELSATLTGLSAASMYQVWVRSYCAEDDQSEAVTEYFSTPMNCAAVEAPIAWDFQSETAEEVPNCWDNSASTATVAYSFYDANEYLWAVFTSGEKKVIRMNNSMLQNGTALVNTPSIVLPAKAQELTFDYSHRASCGAFKLNISTDNGATFTELGSFEATASASTYNLGEFSKANVNLNAYAGKTVILQFFANVDYKDGAIFVDNVDIHDAPSCFKPSDLKVNDVAAKSAKLAWTSDATAWNYQLSEDGENWSDAKAADANPFELSGLKANTLYFARVQNNCGEDGESEWTEAVSFHTECGALSLPFREDFESTEANELPNCWARVSTDGFPVVFDDGAFYSHAYEGSKSLRFYCWGEDQIAVLPELEDALSSAVLSFYYKATDSEDAPEASVGYITDLSDAASFVEVKQLAVTEEYVQEQVTFENAPADAKIAIRYQGGNWFGSLFVDNLEITKNVETPTAIEHTAVSKKAVKRVVNGQVVIEHNGLRYNILGSELK